MEQLNFKDFNEFASLHVQREKHNYYLCTCPSCHENEAFVYKNNLHILKCNRESNCGETFKISYEIEKPIEKKVPTKEELEKLENVLDLVTEECEKYQGTFPLSFSSYRGLEIPILKEANAFVIDEPITGGISIPLLEASKRYNLIIPFYNNNKIERYIFRSLDDSNTPKELNKPTTPKETSIDMLVIDNNKSTVIISESVVDGLSIKQSYNADLIAMRGVGKTNSLIKMVEDSSALKSKTFLIGLDNDEAGIKHTSILKEYLDKNEISYIDLNNLLVINQVKDFNELLVSTNKKDLSLYINTHIDNVLSNKLSNGNLKHLYKLTMNHIESQFNLTNSVFDKVSCTNDLGIVNNYLLNLQFPKSNFIKEENGNCSIINFKNTTFFKNDNLTKKIIDANTEENNLISEGKIKPFVVKSAVSNLSRLAVPSDFYKVEFNGEVELESFISKYSTKTKIILSDEIETAYKISSDKVLLNKNLDVSDLTIGIFKVGLENENISTDEKDLSTSFLKKHLHLSNTFSTVNLSAETVNKCLKRASTYLKTLEENNVINISSNDERLLKKDLSLGRGDEQFLSVDR